MKIHIATDHAGFELKSKILDYLISKGHEVIDHGAKSFDPDDDYPDYIFPCAKAVSKDNNSYGIIFGGSGQGEAIAANRIRGVRAIVYYGFEQTIPILSREHNNANIISIGARFVSENEIYDVIEKWLNISFSKGRHYRRIKKLDNI
tara:strand:+ start:939 stop:1379 length:441 start_codon:yes stop_codon:yes gene_type:complete